MTFFRTLDASSTTRQRKRTFVEALVIIAPLRLRGANLESAEARLYGSKQPKAEAKRLVQFYERKNAHGNISIENNVDLADVQELRVLLIRKMGVVFESDAQTILMRRIEQEIAVDGMTKERFQGLAAATLNMGFGRSEREWRIVER